MQSTHRNAHGRQFRVHTPIPCYAVDATRRVVAEHAVRALAVAPRTQLVAVRIPPRDARAVPVPAGALFRLRVCEGAQVADVNVWNRHNPCERFYSAKTRQIHASHLSTGDSLWSCMPYLRPLATVVHDSIAYGIDDDNAGVHDVIGSRCDPYTNQLMTGVDVDVCCHSNLTRAVLPFGLGEADVHDVFNVFMCTGFMKGCGRYFVKPSPAVVGDYIELFAHIDLLIAASTCPQGDVSVACGDEHRTPVCFPLDMAVFSVEESVAQTANAPWQRFAKPVRYSGTHGLQYQGAPLSE